MLNLNKNTEYNLELGIINSSGNFVDSLDITYEVYNTDTDAIFASGNMTDVGYIYKSDSKLNFTSEGQYRAIYLTPDGYQDGMEQIVVESAVSVETEGISDAVWSQNIGGESSSDLLDQASQSTHTIDKKVVTVPGGGKSPWTHAQRDSIIDQISEMCQNVETISEDIETISEDVETISEDVDSNKENNIQNFKNQNKLEDHIIHLNSSIKNNGKNVEEISSKTCENEENVNDVKNKLQSLDNDLSLVYSTLLKSLSDDQLEEIEYELRGIDT